MSLNTLTVAVLPWGMKWNSFLILLVNSIKVLRSVPQSCSNFWAGNKILFRTAYFINLPKKNNLKLYHLKSVIQTLLNFVLLQPSKYQTQKSTQIRHNHTFQLLSLYLLDVLTLPPGRKNGHYLGAVRAVNVFSPRFKCNVSKYTLLMTVVCENTYVLGEVIETKFVCVCVCV